jgi:hypothetical protein
MCRDRVASFALSSVANFSGSCAGIVDSEQARSVVCRRRYHRSAYAQVSLRLGIRQFRWVLRPNRKSRRTAQYLPLFRLAAKTVTSLFLISRPAGGLAGAAAVKHCCPLPAEPNVCCHFSHRCGPGCGARSSGQRIFIVYRTIRSAFLASARKARRTLAKRSASNAKSENARTFPGQALKDIPSCKHTQQSISYAPRRATLE